MKRFFMLALGAAASVAATTGAYCAESADTMALSLREAIDMARVRSVDAAVALDELRTAYWEWRTFRADQLPELSFRATAPSYAKQYSSYMDENGNYSFVRTNTLQASGELSVSQNVALTGGKVALSSSLDFLRQLDGTPYNRFMSINLQSAPVFLTRAESAAGYCVAAPYQITEGSLVSIRTQGLGTDTYSDIALGDLQISDTTTVADFARAVVTNNELYEYGDAITYFSVLQNVNVETGVPFVTVNVYKVTLDAADLSPLRAVAPPVGFSVSDGFLSHGENIGQGAFAWVHSRRGEGKLLVSSQRLVVINALFDAVSYTHLRAHET